MEILDEIAVALQAGDVPRVGALTAQALEARRASLEAAAHARFDDCGLAASREPAAREAAGNTRDR